MYSYFELIETKQYPTIIQNHFTKWCGDKEMNIILLIFSLVSYCQPCQQTENTNE